MASNPQLGSPQIKRSTTGRLYFREKFADGSLDVAELDLGNITKWRRVNKTETVEHMKSERGIRVVDDTLVHTVGWGYLFTLDEFSPVVLELIQKGTMGFTDVTQAAAPGGSTLTVNDVVQGYSYFIGKYTAEIESVKVGATIKLGWSFNPVTGRLTIVQGGDITDLSDIIVTFNSQALAFGRVSAGTNPRRVGNFTFIESDQYSEAPRAVHTFTGVMWVNEDAEQTAEALGTVDLNVSCQTAPVLDERRY